MAARRPSRAVRGSALAVLTSLAFVAAGCSAVPLSQATTTPTLTPTAAPTVAPATSAPVAVATATASPSPTPTASPTQQTAALNATLYFMGFDITLGTASFDPVSHTLAIDATFKNDGMADTNLGYVTTNNQVTVVWNGPSVPVSLDSSKSSDSPGGTTVKSGFTATMPDGFTLGDGVLTFGTAAQHQSTVALTAGATPTTEEPKPFAVTGTVKVDGYAKVVISGGEVVAATCSGDPDTIAFAPAPKDVESILLNVVESNPNTGYDTISYSTITGPDGISAKGTPGGRYMGSLKSFRTDVLCYTVTAPASGKYTLAWTAERTTAKASFSFVVP